MASQVFNNISTTCSNYCYKAVESSITVANKIVEAAKLCLGNLSLFIQGFGLDTTTGTRYILFQSEPVDYPLDSRQVELWAMVGRRYSAWFIFV